MSLPLTKDEEVQYTSIIDSILATADLNTVTRKKIRAGLQMALGGKDLSDHKDAIKTLIEERFDRMASGVTDEVEPTADANAHGEDGDDEKAATTSAEAGDEDAEGSSEEVDADGEASMPARKKQKRSESEEDADARLAAELQAQENNLARTRMTRGGSVGKKRKAPRKKSAKKARTDDSDGGEGGSEESAPKRKAGGGFQKPFTLSFPLAQLVGEPQLSRPQVVKKLWEHIKANDLQDPSDKRQIRCDDMMHAVFKQSKVDMFQMNKMIGNHLYPVEEEQ